MVEFLKFRVFRIEALGFSIWGVGFSYHADFPPCWSGLGFKASGFLEGPA